jgi:adenylate cyclase
LIVRNQLRQDLAHEVSERGATVARNMAAPATDAFLAKDELAYAQLVTVAIEEDKGAEAELGGMAQLIADLTQSAKEGLKNEGIYKAFVLDKSGTVVAESGKNIAEIAGKHYQNPPNLQSSDSEPFSYFINENGKYAYDIHQPLEQDGQPVGDIHLYMRQDVITDAVRVATVRLIAIMLISLLVGLAFLSFLVRLLMGPIKQLVGGVNAVAAGDFSKQIALNRGDELGELVDAYNGMAKSLAEKEAVQEALAKYTSKDLVNQMLTDGSKLELGGQKIEATILFSELHGMAALAGSMEPEKFVGIMNEYLEIETDIIMKNGGSIDKFIGSEVMALWGLSGQDVAEQAYHCVKAGVEIQDAIAKHNAAREKRGETSFECVIGINTGKVVSGNMGSSVKMDNTVLGADVNLAARLGLVAAKGGQTIISHYTYSLVSDRFKIDKLAPVQLKGIKEPVPLFWPRKLA